jgi:hypothetical protein
MFAAAIKVAGQILRESGDVVTLPFGSEYSLHLKNLNTVRAMVSVNVDGNDVTDGRWLILEPNTSFDLERSIRDGNMILGNKFKFIERTSAVENHRGIGSSDGLIRVEYKFEIPQYRPSYRPSFFRSPESSYMKGACSRSMSSFNSGGARGISGQSIGSTLGDSTSASYTSANAINSTNTGGIGEGITFSKLAPDEGEVGMYSYAFPVDALELPNDAGITVEGSISNQQFSHGDWFPTESSAHVLVFRLRGQHGKLKVGHPVTVKTQLHCSICGRSNKHNNKFCGGCGASLTIVGAGDRIIA